MLLDSFEREAMLRQDMQQRGLCTFYGAEVQVVDPNHRTFSKSRLVCCRGQQAFLARRLRDGEVSIWQRLAVVKERSEVSLQLVQFDPRAVKRADDRILSFVQNGRDEMCCFHVALPDAGRKDSREADYRSGAIAENRVHATPAVESGTNRPTNGRRRFE